jgi:hypothetical protein
LNRYVTTRYEFRDVSILFKVVGTALIKFEPLKKSTAPGSVINAAYRKTNVAGHESSHVGLHRCKFVHWVLRCLTRIMIKTNLI